MLAVALGREELQPLLATILSLAAVNGPEQSVAAGSPEAIAALEERLAPARPARAATSPAAGCAHTHAFHSSRCTSCSTAAANWRAQSSCAHRDPLPEQRHGTG